MALSTGPAGSAVCDRGEEAVATATLFERAVAESDLAVERNVIEHDMLRRLRLLVQRTDELVDACEVAHLRDMKRAPDKLIRQVRDVLLEARVVLPLRESAPTSEAVLDGAAPTRAPFIRHLMDQIWAIQGATFDHLLPWRREFDDNDDDLTVDGRRRRSTSA